MKPALRAVARGFAVLLVAMNGAIAATPKLPTPHAAPAEVGKDLIGTAAQPFTFDTWLNSKPLSLEGLRGKVVVIRWWTAPGCPFCAASAESLESLWKKHSDRGLVVVGAYHHKDESIPLTREHVE